MLFDYYFFTIHDIDALLRSDEALAVQVIDGSVILAVGSDVESLNAGGLPSVVAAHHKLWCVCCCIRDDEVATTRVDTHVLSGIVELVVITQHQFGLVTASQGCRRVGAHELDGTLTSTIAFPECGCC